jgi:NodT family efflux transporter outer membrane factor (OMF) lipoprotein
MIRRRRGRCAPTLLCLAFWLGGCVMVGPDYRPPAAPIESAWIESAEPEIGGRSADYGTWWKVFGDPVLDRLVDSAYEQNLSLRIAGLRVLEAQARRGIAVGNLFPQSQQAFGAYTRQSVSENIANVPSNTGFSDWQAGFDAAWELDFWGRFRRGIESADAALLSSVASYDDVLVSLVAEVARTYVQLRTLEERLAVARENVKIQRRSFEIAEAKFRNGKVTELDAAQARSLLADTESTIPVLEAGIRQAKYSLSVLLGLPPQDLREILAGPPAIPSAAAEVAIGIPAELLRRRPDVRRAERDLAAQSAQIGIAEADLYPSFFLIGDISLSSEDLATLFAGDSFGAFGGPSFQWPILNYGRIRNNVRVQDARFQQLAVAYENTVLLAQQEVESAIAAYAGALRQVESLSDSVQAARRSVHLSNLQYREGTVDYIRVLNAQQDLLGAEDRLTDARGSVALNLVAIYKALGGGWEIRRGKDLVPDETKQELASRTNWGSLLSSEAQSADLEAAASGTEKNRGWWRWRWWWPVW